MIQHSPERVGTEDVYERLPLHVGTMMRTISMIIRLGKASPQEIIGLGLCLGVHICNNCMKEDRDRAALEHVIFC